MKLFRENITTDFKRGIHPKRAMSVGLPRSFPDYSEAAEWAVRNLELITDGEYSPNNIITLEEKSILPDRLKEHLKKWRNEITLEASGKVGIIVQSILDGWVYYHLKDHGLIREP